jgi:hypothetical protein
MVNDIFLKDFCQARAQQRGSKNTSLPFIGLKSGPPAEGNSGTISTSVRAISKAASHFCLCIDLPANHQYIGMSPQARCDLVQLFICFEMIAEFEPTDGSLKVESVGMLEIGHVILSPNYTWSQQNQALPLPFADFPQLIKKQVFALGSR